MSRSGANGPDDIDQGLEPDVLDPDGAAPTSREQQLAPARSDPGQLARTRAMAQAEERRRHEGAEHAARQERRRIIQGVKEEVIGSWRSWDHEIPSEVKAQALQQIEAELARLRVEELSRWELTQIAEGIRDRLFRPVMAAEDAARRRAKERAAAERRRADEEAEAAQRRADEERERELHAIFEPTARVLKKQRLVAHGIAVAEEELQGLPDLDIFERREIRAAVETELAEELTGEESEVEVDDLIHEILDEQLGEDGGEDEEENDDDDDDDGDEGDDDDEEEEEEEEEDW